MGGAQVNEFGQCPRQLFQAPHPPRLASPSERGNGAPPAATCLCVCFPHTNAFGFCGSCDMPEPGICLHNWPGLYLVHSPSFKSLFNLLCSVAGALSPVKGTATSSDTSSGDAGGRALSLALIATIQAAADAADAEAAEPLPAEVSLKFGPRTGLLHCSQTGLDHKIQVPLAIWLKLLTLLPLLQSKRIPSVSLPRCRSCCRSWM